MLDDLSVDCAAVRSDETATRAMSGEDMVARGVEGGGRPVRRASHTPSRARKKTPSGRSAPLRDALDEGSQLKETHLDVRKWQRRSFQR